MPAVARFEDIAADFRARVERMVWCTMTTVDRKGRPRGRIVHPLWEGSTGWLLTSPQSLKAKHVAKTPWVSFSYWDPAQEQVHVECRVSWETDKHRVWNLFRDTPMPVGYDPALFWPAGPDDASFGVLKLTPWRVELWSLGDLMSQTPPRVWTP